MNETRQKVFDFVRSFGIAPNEVAAVHITHDAVSIVMFAVNAEGRRYLDPATDGVAVEARNFPMASLVSVDGGSLPGPAA